eukprot:TRINITY_DN25553_c0_g1_i1.p1 TRINITY_DN25553_c0_g1~~TRINITY_DN25553_c0_g1_i1.p1  ORF type:complete len:199 (+),score=27.89 TRINITY_DN25553_c0_g1_i1:186-782(+)
MDFRPDQKLLEQLLEMGLHATSAVKALYHTHNSGVEVAMDWILDERKVEVMDKELLSKILNELGVDSDESDDSEENAPSFKMVFVINDSLGMSPGKIAAQVGHATLGLYRTIKTSEQKFSCEDLTYWEESYERMIVLRGDTTEELLELIQKAKSLNLPYHLVEDAGFTQVNAGSQTVLSIFGEDSEVNKVTGKLKLLK